MKRLTKGMVIGILVISCLAIFPQKIPSQGRFLYCVVHFRMENRDRHCYKNVNAECSWDGHTVPWGNWGVRSNLGDKNNNEQFQGWYPVIQWPFPLQLQWNSCYIEYPPPDDYYYNDANYTEQHSEDTYYSGRWHEINGYTVGGVRYIEIDRMDWDDG